MRMIASRMYIMCEGMIEGEHMNSSVVHKCTVCELLMHVWDMTSNIICVYAMSLERIDNGIVCV
jgi:hypothetical protein